MDRTRKVLGSRLPRAFLLLSLLAGVIVAVGGEPLIARDFPDAPGWLRDVADSSGKTLGDTEAPLRIVEYTDFECPYCRRFARGSFHKIVKNYVASGQVRYTVRHFPLPVHDHARRMANAAECAAEQNRFWEYKFFLMNLRFKLTDHNLIQLGRSIELPRPEEFRRCVRERRKIERVEEERNAGRKKGVSATPTLFVGDTKLEGAYPFHKMKPIIEKELRTAN